LPICPGTNVTFTATPTNEGTNPGYQWYLNGNQVGANSSTYSSSTFVAGDAIEVHLSECYRSMHRSGYCSLKCDSHYHQPLIAPNNNHYFSSFRPICPGQNVTFIAAITDGRINPRLSMVFEWQPGGTNSNTYSSNTLNNGDMISVHLVNAVGPCIFLTQPFQM